MSGLSRGLESRGRRCLVACLAVIRPDLIADDHGDHDPEEESADDQRGHERPDGADREASERSGRVEARER